MNTETFTVSERQAQRLADLVTQYNESYREMVSYFAAVVDGLGLSPETEYVSVDPKERELVVRVPSDA